MAFPLKRTHRAPTALMSGLVPA